MIRTTIAIVVLALAGCTTPRIETYSISTAYDHQAAQIAMQPGAATIYGSAFLRQRGGGIVTCAGRNATLVAPTLYAAQRLIYIYRGPLVDGQTSFYRAADSLYRRMEFSPDPTQYRSDARYATCDAQGNFSFGAVKDGQYFVIAPVIWEVGGAIQGGTLATKVTVSRGKAARVVMGM